MVMVVVMVIVLIMMTSVYAIAAVIKANGGVKKMTQAGWVHMLTFSKRIELESPGCSGFERN